MVGALSSSMIALAIFAFGAHAEPLPADGRGADRRAETGAAAGLGEFVLDTTAPETEAGNLGIAAVTDAIRDNADIGDILREAFPPKRLLPEAREIEAHKPTLLASADPAAVGSASIGERDAPGAIAHTDDATVDLNDGRLSLRQVLRSVASPQRTRKDGDDLALDGDGGSFDVSQRLLDSRLAAEALAHIVSVSSIDGSLSVFGVGSFEVQIAPSGHGFVVTDLVSNASFSLDAGYADPAAAVRRPPPTKIDVVGVVLNFLESTTGFLVMSGGAMIMLLWSMSRFLARLRG
jgi:hypothetical protein